MIYGRRLGRVEKEILEQLTAGDLLVGFLCSARSTRLMYKIAQERAMQRYRTKRTIDSLAQKGLVRLYGDTIAITKKGKTALEEAADTIRSRLGSTVWDGKWRIVTFDIPENLHLLRHRVRNILKRTGFVKLHHSVWIFPHESHELVELIRQDGRIRRHVLYGVLESIDDDTHLKKTFSL